VPISDQLRSSLAVRRQIAQLRRVARKPRPVMPAPRWPNGARMRYAIALNAVLRDVDRAVHELLLPRLPPILAAARAELAREDAPADDGEGAMGAVRNQVGGELTPERLDRLARSVAVDVSKHNRVELGRTLKAAVGFDPIPVQEQLSTQLEAFVKQNVKLVQGMTDELLAKLEGIVLRGVREGRRVEDVARDIREAFGVSKRRAMLIANDQVASMNGELTRVRHSRIGITSYRWSTSKDARVRKSHRLLEGTVQQWAKPPSVGGGKHAHPGGDVGCRCSAIPVVDDMLAALGIQVA
jgi:SPP1 gp7 family putative phage head morphogenesis protein